MAVDRDYWMGVAGNMRQERDDALATVERLRAVPATLRAEHFAVAHTDMVGDDDFRAGYLEALKDCERALNQQRASY